jgi:predicted solute-binding protein
MAAHNITPVVIQCSPATLRKGEKWTKITETPPHFTITVCQDIEISPFSSNDDMQSKKSRELTRHLESYFESRLNDQSEPKLDHLAHDHAA